MNEEDKSKKISDMELSLISAISGLDNKLEELDHNLALISKSGTQFSNSNISENDINKKIQNFEEKLISLDKKISEKILITKNDKYINTIPSKSKIGPVRKGYALAENLRLKRIDSLEQQLSDLAKQFNEKFPASKNNNEIKVSPMEENTKSEIVITEDFVYERSKAVSYTHLTLPTKA